MNRTTRWQPWVAVFALGLVGLVGGCSDKTADMPMVLDPSLAVIGTPNQQFWKQCENQHDYTFGCNWVTGNLTHTANTWHEGDFVPKILRIDDITNGDPIEVVMSYGFLKGGLTTHDFLGDWNLTQTGADPCSDKYFAPFCTSGSIVPALAGSVTSDPTGANSMYDLSKAAILAACGPTGTNRPQMVADMTEALDAVVAAGGYDDLIIRGINVSDITLTDLYFDGCPATGDAEAWLTYTVTPTTAAYQGDTPGLLLLMAAHVARGEDLPTGFGDWNNGGAGGVNGSPYHLGLKFLDDESTGSMDLQMSAAAVVVPQPSAYITITPDGTNRVGDTHTFTATVMVSPDEGDPFVPAPDGTQINFSKASGPGSLSASSCTTAGGTGSCSVDLVSDATGQTVVNASATVTVSTFPLSVSTDGTGDNSGPATKTWVDAKIAISPLTDLNPVGEEHTFTVTVMKDVGDGNGWVAAAGESVTAAQTGSLAPVTLGGTCTTTTTDASGQCTFTYNSATPGTLTLEASSTLNVGGESISVSTDGTGFNSGPATKTWGNAWITIGSDDTNRVNDPHTFTVTVMRQVGTSGAEAVSGVTVTPTGDTGFLTGTGTCETGTTDASGQCTIIVNSSSPGQASIGASANVPIDGTSISVSTDGTGSNSGPATKTWVDAKISISPLTDLNPVGVEHTFTVTVEKDLGDGNGWVPANGESVSASQGGSLATVTLGGTCTTGNTNASGQCTFTYNSATPGTLILTASSTLNVGGVPITVSTDGSGNNSGPATKTWGRAWITIAADGTNEVNDPHTFTVTVMREVGTAGPEAVSGVTVTPTGNTGFLTGTGTCETGTTDASGQCTIIVNSSSAGQATMGASANVPIDGTSIAVSTDGVSPNSGTATKTWVDAKIAIAADDTNPTGVPHTFTVTVMEDAGLGAGWVAAAGETVTPERVGAGVGNFDLTSGCFVTPTDASGQCTVTVNSQVAGTFVVKATSNVQVGGLSLTRTTDGAGNNSGPATKTWADARISILGNATNEVGTSHTFTVKVEENDGTGFAAASGETVSGAIIADVNGGTATITGGTCTTGTTDGSGECTLIISSPTTGQTIIGASSTVQVAGIGVSTSIVSTDGGANTRAATGPGIKTWVDAYITIAADATNMVNEPHTFTVTVMEDAGDGNGFVAASGETVTYGTSGTAGSITGGTCTTTTTDASGQCTIIVNSATAGYLTVTASSDVLVGGETVSRTTDGVAPNSGPATKTWLPDVETAWASNSMLCDGNLPYPGDNWATYVNFGDQNGDPPADYSDKTVALCAGQHYQAGTVAFHKRGQHLDVTIALTGWYFEAGDGKVDVHLQGYTAPPTISNPPPGQFEYSFEAASGEGAGFSFSIQNFFNEPYLYLGVHGLVIEGGPGN